MREILTVAYTIYGLLIWENLKTNMNWAKTFKKFRFYSIFHELATWYQFCLPRRFIVFISSDNGFKHGWCTSCYDWVLPIILPRVCCDAARKEKQAAVSKTSKNGKTLSIRQTNALKKAMKDSSDYNALLLQQRREERASYYDMQTQLIHIPARRNKKLPPNMTIPSKYPVALLPGQYQEYYHSYSFRVLNQLPWTLLSHFHLHLSWR